VIDESDQCNLLDFLKSDGKTVCTREFAYSEAVLIKMRKRGRVSRVLQSPIPEGGIRFPGDGVLARGFAPDRKKREEKS